MTTGFNFIGDMKKEELIAELIAYYREEMLKVDDMDNLKGYVIQVRLKKYHALLMEEARMDPRPRGIFGGWGLSDE